MIERVNDEDFVTKYINEYDNMLCNYDNNFDFNHTMTNDEIIRSFLDIVETNDKINRRL